MTPLIEKRRSMLRLLLRRHFAGNRTVGDGCRTWSGWGPALGSWRRCWWRCWDRLGTCAWSDGPAWFLRGSLGSTQRHQRQWTPPLFSVRNKIWRLWGWDLFSTVFFFNIWWVCMSVSLCIYVLSLSFRLLSSRNDIHFGLDPTWTVLVFWED